METILNDIKEHLAIVIEDTSFDSEILSNIGISLATVEQMSESTGVLVNKDTKWDDYFTDLQNKQPRYQSAVKSFCWINTKILFDPPTQQATLKAYMSMRDEMYWRIGVEERTITNTEIEGETTS